MNQTVPIFRDDVAECPKCHFSMEPLRQSAVLNRDHGYILDDGLDSTAGVRWYEPDDNIVTSFLFGNLYRFVWRFLEPIWYRVVGNRANRRYQKILTQYPRSLICTHCAYLFRRP